MWPNYLFTVPKEKRVRFIIHTDCKNEADDQFTLCHALMTDFLDVRGIVGGHFAQKQQEGSARASVEEIEKILRLMRLEDRYPVFEGADRGIPDEQTPIDSEGARFIIREAMREDPRPLYIGMQGAITDLACAILMEPRITERMTCIWIGGGTWPEGGEEFNLKGDIPGANVVLSSEMPLWQVPFDVYTRFRVSLAELQLKVYPCGEIGAYLFRQMVELNDQLAWLGHWPHGETWSLGDEGVVCALLQGSGRGDNWEMRPAPRIGRDMRYEHSETGRPIRVYRDMDVRMDLEDFFAKLKLNFGK